MRVESRELRGWSRVYREPQGINYVYATLTATEQTIVTAASSSCWVAGGWGWGWAFARLTLGASHAGKLRMSRGGDFLNAQGSF